MVATSAGMSWSQPGAEKIFIKSRLDLGRNHQFQITTQGQALEKFGPQNGHLLFYRS
jgi:hypothetical protein